MAELLRSIDPSLIAIIEGLLDEADIPYHVTDRNMSVIEGSINAIQTRIVVPDGAGLVVRNAILRVTRESGGATAKCPRCKTWVEVPLRYSG